MRVAQNTTSMQSDVCPYSFVSCKHSLTPELSARSSAALRAHSSEPLLARLPQSPQELSASLKMMHGFYKRDKNYAAVKTNSEHYPHVSLETVFSLDFDQHYQARIRAGLIVGEMKFDPRFATSTMWETGFASEDDRRTVYDRMAWVAQFGEKGIIKRAPQFSQIQIADFRSRHVLNEVWEIIDADIHKILREEKSRPDPISPDLHVSGTPRNKYTPPSSRENVEEGTERSFKWKQFVVPTIIALVFLSSASFGYKMYRGYRQTAQTGAPSGSGSGSADPSGAEIASGSAEMPDDTAASDSAKDTGAGAGAGSGLGSDLGTRNGAADGLGSGTDVGANLPTEAPTPTEKRTPPKSAKMHEACAWMRGANAIVVHFNAASCPTVETVPGCTLKKSDDKCELSFEELAHKSRE